MEPYRTTIARMLSSARRGADLVIVSAHVSPNWGEPSQAMQALAHDLLDLGADLYWGHSNHNPQRIESYKGKAILYSTGDFIDDYMVDQDQHNDLSFLFILEMKRGRVARIRLYPTCVEDLRVRLANEREASFLKRTMRMKCAAFGAKIDFANRVGLVTIG